MKKFIIVSLSLFSLNSIANDETLEIYTGNISGTYYSIGQELCNPLENCQVATSNGSIENIDELTDSDNKRLAIVQSDVLHDAYYGLGVFEGYDYKNIATLCPLYEEAYTIVVRANSKIKSFKDLKKKIVNVGKKNSGNYQATKKLLELYNMKMYDFKHISYLPIDTQGEALCKGTIDAAIYAIHHPSKLINETAKLCNIRILTLDNQNIQNLVKTQPYYIYTIIKANTYPGNNKDTKTLGVMATLAAPLSLSSNYVYNLMHKINDSKYKLKLLHPKLHDISLSTMVPLHPGAKEFYRYNH